MDALAEAVDRIAAETGFSGVVRVDQGDTIAIARAYGLAHRGYHIANTVDCRFGIASGAKGPLPGSASPIPTAVTSSWP